MIRNYLVFVGLALCAALTHAAPLPEAKPEEAGMSSQRLQRLDALLQTTVDSGELAGMTAAIARKGKLVYFKSVGKQDKGANVAMNNESIFRLYSMTKPVVSVAAMMLVEEGRLALHEPVSKYIPEFKDMKVAVESYDAKTGAQTVALVPAKRQITVQDLLRHTSGLTYAVLGDKAAVKEQYKQAGLGSIEALYRGETKWTNESFAKAMAALPLRYEPGSTWEYGHSTDILGRVVEVASGQALDVHLAERIFKPLKMQSTAFQLNSAQAARLAQPQPDPKTGQTPDLIDVTKPITWFASGHGLAGSAGDYLRFCQMLLNGGELDGARLLGRKTVSYIASNHVSPSISLGTLYIPGPGYGFGLGFGVREQQGMSDWNGSIGDYYWGGYAGTYFFIDPKEQLTALLMFVDPTRRQHYRGIFRALVLQAIVD